MTPAEASLLKTVMKRFNKFYFIRALGERGYFCMPNFVFRVEEETLYIQWLTHVSEADEAGVVAQLRDLPYKILPKRLTLAQIEAESGHTFPDPPVSFED